MEPLLHTGSVPRASRVPLPRPRKLSPTLFSQSLLQGCHFLTWTLWSVSGTFDHFYPPCPPVMPPKGPHFLGLEVFSVSRKFLGGMGSKWPCGLREGFGGHWSSVCQVSHQAPFPVQEETLGWGLCFSKTLPSDLTRILPTVPFTLKVGMETCCLWAGERLQSVQYMRLPRWALSAWRTSVQRVHCMDKRQENIQRGCPVLGWGVSLKPKGDT